MIRYLIKNNLKMMLRSPVNILIYIMGPAIIAAVLTSAFTSLMNSYEGSDGFEVGYSIEEGSSFEAYIDTLADNFKENDIKLIEYEAGDAEKIIHENNLAGFVEFGKKDYKIYEIQDSKIEGHILEYALNEACENAGNAVYMAKLGIDGNTPEKKEVPKVSVEHPRFVAAINSTDYYGIIEIIYFAAFPIVCAAGLFASEKKNKIEKRLQISSISDTKLYLAKLISIAITVMICSIISMLFGIIFLGVHWGNMAISLLVIFMIILAMGAVELLIYSVTNSVAATVIITFTVVWLSGFFGGSFETYMFSSHPQILKNLSLIYYGNRSLVELSSMGESSYTSKIMIITVVVCAVFSLAAISVNKLRRGRA